MKYADFEKINWLPVENRVSQCIVSHVFKFFNKGSPDYVDELFIPVNRTVSTRQGSLRLFQPFRKTNAGKSSISYLGPSIWNGLPDIVKENKILNTFKHKLKDHFLEKLLRKENDQFIYY